MTEECCNQKPGTEKCIDNHLVIIQAAQLQPESFSAKVQIHGNSSDTAFAKQPYDRFSVLLPLPLTCKHSR
eukprot:1158531-Pelagomonas_calceolata.AAC.1